MNIKKRIFIAINFKEHHKKELVKLEEQIDAQFSDINPIKWTRKQNLHTTLQFVGYLRDEDLMEVFQIVEKIANNTNKFVIEFDQVNYFPIDKEAKKMIWILGKSSDTLLELNNQIKEDLLEAGKTEEFIPHITLGRINQLQFKAINPEELPQLENEEVNLKFLVESIEIMESELKKGGAHYTALKSFKLI